MRQRPRTKVRSPSDAGLEKVRLGGVAFAGRETSRVAAPRPEQRTDSKCAYERLDRGASGQVGRNIL